MSAATLRCPHLCGKCMASVRCLSVYLFVCLFASQSKQVTKVRLLQARLILAISYLGVVVMITAGHVTHQPIGVLEYGSVNRRLKLTDVVQPDPSKHGRGGGKKTISSAIAEGPRDASCQLKSCQSPHNSAETNCTTSPKPSISYR